MAINYSSVYVLHRLKKLGASGLLTEKDIPAIDTQNRKVMELMIDGVWHDADTIRETAGGSEGLRRLRQLREIKGIKVLKRKKARSRMFEYKLARKD